MCELIRNYELKHIKNDIPNLHTGDTVAVTVWIVEGDKKRVQLFEGIVISIKNKGLNSSFTVRKISSGEGVERVFQVHSPMIDRIKVKKFGMIRKAKLYYLRNLKGKSARIKTRFN